MKPFDAEYRTTFDMENDIGERFDMLEQKAQSAFMDIFGKDIDPFDNEPTIVKPRWIKDDLSDYD